MVRKVQLSAAFRLLKSSDVALPLNLGTRCLSISASLLKLYDVYE